MGVNSSESKMEQSYLKQIHNHDKLVRGWKHNVAQVQKNLIWHSIIKKYCIYIENKYLHSTCSKVSLNYVLAILYLISVPDIYI